VSFSEPRLSLSLSLIPNEKDAAAASEAFSEFLSPLKFLHTYGVPTLFYKSPSNSISTPRLRATASDVV
jgi:hypothetical protein